MRQLLRKQLSVKSELKFEYTKVKFFQEPIQRNQKFFQNTVKDQITTAEQIVIEQNRQLIVPK